MLTSRFKDDNIVEIGIDEAGRGSFWGPIMAGAVIIPNENTWTDKHYNMLIQIRDSKKLSIKKREKIAEEIKELIPTTAIGIVSADEINANGITWANKEAFRRAIQNLNIDSKCRLLIDGDSKYVAIAAASILAKVAHDKWIENYCITHPDCNEKYNLLKCKGYGTAKHRDGIKIYGGHELHRSLYIQKWLPQKCIIKIK